MVVIVQLEEVFIEPVRSVAARNPRLTKAATESNLPRSLVAIGSYFQLKGVSDNTMFRFCGLLTTQVLPAVTITRRDVR